ncbi:MAG: hypothetical protein MR508_04680 [Lachnospiraceae bacterium]|nr:hypothetical protein [Lachnospiraceae bacterium]
MRSKTSFFNKAIYKKNMTLYWPIPVCYLLYELIRLVGSLWFGLRQSAASGNDAMSTLFSSLAVGNNLCMVAVVAVLIGMAMFGYLFSVKSANMIHALPVTRTELYVTNVVSGLTCILLPQLLVFLVSVVFCLTRGITCVQYLAQWLFGMASAGVFFYSLVCFCIMITGLLAALPFLFLLINYLSVGIVLGTQYVLSSLGYGLCYSGVKQDSLGYLLSPLAYLTEMVGFRVNYAVSDNGNTTVLSAAFEGTGSILLYIAAAVVLYMLAWYGYQKRQLERTGDLLTFGWIRPLFRWGFGMAAGFFAGILISNFLGDVAVRVPEPVVLGLVLVTGIIGFYIAQMLIQKSFRVFRLRRLKECFVFGLAVCGCFGAMYGIGYSQQQYIPDESQVTSAYVYMNYPAEFQGADVKRVIEIHKEILSHKKEFRQTFGQQKNVTSVRLTYCLKDGSVLSRSYRIPVGEEASGRLGSKVFACEAAPDSFMKYMAGFDYDQITEIEDAQIEFRNKNQNYANLSIDEEAARKLYEAVQKDAQAGTIQKYNLENYFENDGGTTNQYACAYLTIYLKHTGTDWVDVYTRYQTDTHTDTSQQWENYEAPAETSGSLYMKFGADCENVMKALVENGVISSVNDIIFSVEG